MREYEFKLGERVTFVGGLRRMYDTPRYHRKWEEHPGSMDFPREGVVVGIRTLANGRAFSSSDEGTEFVADEHFTAYLIAYHMRRKPVLVRPENLRKLETGSSV